MKSKPKTFKEMLELRNLSQYELAKRCGRKQPQIQGWASNKHRISTKNAWELGVFLVAKPVWDEKSQSYMFQPCRRIG